MDSHCQESGRDEVLPGGAVEGRSCRGVGGVPHARGREEEIPEIKAIMLIKSFVLYNIGCGKQNGNLIKADRRSYRYRDVDAEEHLVD